MIDQLGSRLLQSMAEAANFLALVFDVIVTFIKQCLFFKFRFWQTVGEIFEMGVRSLPIVLFSMVFVAVMLVLEFSFHMKLVLKQDSLVPAFATVILVRELGPVITSLLLASRIGASIATEISLMKMTEQLDALEVIGVDCLEFLATPRWLGCVVASVSLFVVSLAASMFLGAVASSIYLGYTMGQFWSTMFTFTNFDDITKGIVKTIVFSSLVAWLAVHRGLRSEAGSRGVGNAATSAVVQSSILIIVSDFVLTYLFYAV